MNDLSGLSWDSKPSSQPPNKPANQGPARHTPSPGLSRQGTPGLVPAQSSGSRLSSSLGQGASKGANADSFSNLLAPRPGKPSGQSLSLEERQRQLSAQRSGIQGSSDPFASSDAHFWEGLGSGRGTPALVCPYLSSFDSLQKLTFTWVGGEEHDIGQRKRVGSSRGLQRCSTGRQVEPLPSSQTRQRATNTTGFLSKSTSRRLLIICDCAKAGAVRVLRR